MQNDTSRKCLRGGARRAALPDLSFGGCAFPPFSCLQRTVPVALSQELCRPPAPARLPAAPPGPAAQRSPTPSPVILGYLPPQAWVLSGQEPRIRSVLDGRTNVSRERQQGTATRHGPTQ